MVEGENIVVDDQFTTLTPETLSLLGSTIPDYPTSSVSSADIWIYAIIKHNMFRGDRFKIDQTKNKDSSLHTYNDSHVRYFSMARNGNIWAEDQYRRRYPAEILEVIK